MNVPLANSRRWHVVAASAAGSSHIRMDIPCQDSHSIAMDAPDGVLIAAVADGAGSARMSDVGSRIAAHTATRTGAELLRLHTSPYCEAALEEVLNDAFAAALEALIDEARQREISVRDLATTLLIAICTPLMTATAQIGDGAIVGILRDGNDTQGNDTQGNDNNRDFTMLSPPQRGEFANQTNFITTDDWESVLDIRTQRTSVSHLAMFTDGVQSLALDSASDNAPHDRFFKPMFDWAGNQEDEEAAARTLSAFLTSPRVTGRTDDDVTLLLAIAPELESVK